MEKIQINNLKKAGKELNTLLFDPDRKNEGWIDITLDQSVLEDDIKKAIDLLEPGEELSFSEKVQNVIHLLKQDVNESTPIDTKEDVPGPIKPGSKKIIIKKPTLTLLEYIEIATLDGLKLVVKENAVFMPLQKTAQFEKHSQGLRTKMLRLLFPSARYLEVTTPTKADVEKAKIAPKPKRKGKIDTIVECVENAGEKGVSHEDILKILDEKFPGNAPLSMLNTIRKHVPNQIRRDRFDVIEVSKGYFKKA